MSGKGGARPSPALLVFLGLYALAVTAALVFDVPVGFEVGRTFLLFAREMAFILPAAFVVIGLFEVWVPREAVERHLGSGGRRLVQWFWMVLLASTTVGGLYVSFPAEEKRGSVRARCLEITSCDF